MELIASAYRTQFPARHRRIPPNSIARRGSDHQRYRQPVRESAMWPRKLTTSLLDLPSSTEGLVKLNVVRHLGIPGRCQVQFRDEVILLHD